jgi:hypothetical protein
MGNVNWLIDIGFQHSPETAMESGWLVNKQTQTEASVWVCWIDEGLSLSLVCL